MLPDFSNVFIFHPDIEILGLALGAGWMGILGTFSMGERRDVLLCLLIVSMEMPSSLKPVWDAVQKRANGSDQSLLSLERSVCQVRSWLALGNLHLGRGGLTIPRP